MTSPLDRRLAKLEAAASAADGYGQTRVVLVKPDENADEKVAALGPLRRGDHLIVVQFVKAADIQSPPTLQ